MQDPVLVVLIGLPGSGKSTWVAQRSGVPISSDHTRLLLADDPTDQSIHGAVFSTMRYLITRRLALKRPVTYIDATNLTRKDRRAWIKLAELHGARAEAVYFDVPVETCKERNRTRDRVVPDEAIDLMAAKLQMPCADEGWWRITVERGSQTGSHESGSAEASPSTS